MANLRLLDLKVPDCTTIVGKFTDELHSLLNTSNVTVEAITPGVPDATVLKVEVLYNLFFVTTRPMTPGASYYVTFKSTNSSQFKSKNGTAHLLNDGSTNKKLIIGAGEPENKIRDELINDLKDGPFNLHKRTLVRDAIDCQAVNLSRALYDIRQAKNDNYLTVEILDEKKIRGAGPFDRLNEEGAYQIIRIAKTQTGATVSNSLSFDEFPGGPISLLTATITNEKLIAGSGESTFNGLTLTVKKNFVSKVTRVLITYSDASTATYDLEAYGYQINNPRYDEYASTLLTLDENQIKLNTVALESGFRQPVAGDEIRIDYEYLSKGRVIDEETVTVTQVLDSIREVAPPIVNEFSLQFAPVVTSANIIATVNGITFLDPESNPPFSETHPAFVTELEYRLDGLPAAVGQYCVDYENGRVFVYGAVSNDGTGNIPPVATYKYRKSFSSRLDYTYDVDSVELVANPLRDLENETATISFNYEETLIPDVDYKAQIHSEILDERIDNRLNSSISLSVQNTPITNVFRVYNETSGEVYRIQRFNDHSVFFSSNTPPRILAVTRERAAFVDVLNEQLIIDSEFINVKGTKVFKVLLENSNIISATEDVIASSYNSSANFSRTDIFITELYFDGQILTETANTDRLEIGQYQIDYRNGILYVGVPGTQNDDLGTINYKKPVIAPAFPHIIGISELYHSISTITGISKRIEYISFEDGEINPSSFDYSDERFTNGDETLSYVLDNDQITVTDDIKDVRNVFDVYDLNNNIYPTNFADGCEVSANVITLADEGILKEETLIVQPGNIVIASFISDGIEVDSVDRIVRLNDNEEFGVSSVSGYDITLNATGAPSPGDIVNVSYRIKLNGAATPVVDYNRGDYFIDYTYLADEILVSYEYGDNCLDFRTSSVLDTGKEYYVSYKVGALRDALLKNFGSLVDIPVMKDFDTTLPRENYRDALKAALQSFTKGPTIPAMKQLVSNITHIDPEIKEAAFENWSLGVSLLYPNAVNYSDDIELVSSKYDNGALVNSSNQTITLPVVSNLRIEEGTLETWFTPEWNGLDNDATLTFSSLTKNDILLSEDDIYIGADSHHPTYDLNNEFSISRQDTSSPVGLPSAIYTQTGMFIYYDDTAERWKVLAKDKLVTDGYVYAGKIESSGEVYDVKQIPGLGEINDILRSGMSTIDFEFHLDGYDVTSPDGYVDGYNMDGYFPADGYEVGYSFDGIHFMADDEHYLFDFGATKTTNRFSVFKDGRGYLNFRVYDSGKLIPGRKSFYEVTSDISGWRAGEKHHIATSWKINTSDRRDELHLFIDGTEVPNIMRYGGRPIGTNTDRFRTVKPEYIVGTVPKNTVAGKDLNTILGSAVVTSDSVNFTTSGINPGDDLLIDELGFETYTIVSVNGNSLTLNSTMPATLEDASFSANPYATIISSQVDLFANIAVSIFRNGTETEIPGLRADIPGYKIEKNALNENVITILGNAEAGDRVLVRTLGLNHRRCRDRQFIWGNTTNIIKTQLPPPINLDEVKIFPVLLPLLPIGPDNAAIISGEFVKTNISLYVPSNSTQGRTLAISMNGNNVNFSNPATVTIIGSTSGGPISEVVTFSAAGIKNTSNKFISITSATVNVTPIVYTRNSVSIEIKEAYPITYSEGNNDYPVLRFSYKVQTGFTLSNAGTSTVTDAAGYFPESTVGQILVINTPLSVAGTYTITSRIDNNNVTISPTPATTFTGGTYDIFNVSIGRSGFQNGLFVLETAGGTNTPYLLKEGLYEFDYAAYLEIPFAPVNKALAYIGSDMEGNKQADGVFDELRILSSKLTDVRVGESALDNQDYITTDFTSLKPFEPDSSTLTLIHFDNLPLTNDAEIWVSAEKGFRQSSASVNNNFSKSIVITDRPMIVDNAGLLTTASEGTIEFWVSPRYDSYNDPHFRFYFDASGSLVENVTSISNGTVKTAGRIGSVISVRLQTDTTNTGVNYYNGGSLQSDFQTIKLGKALPYQKTPVKIEYIPSGLLGDRISIYKDREGYITFNVRANEIDYQVRQPVFWARDSWHRVRATFKFNRADNLDEIRLWVDGEERGTLLFGNNLLFGDGAVFGQGFAGVDNSVLIADINFSDSINEFFIGSDYLGSNTAQAKIDNLRISNIARTPITVAGQTKDINYSSNLDIVYPVVEDVFTTYLLNFDKTITKADDFALLRDERFGIFNFTLNIIDSFGIVLGSAKVQQILESLISALKPAQSKVEIKYIR